MIELRLDISDVRRHNREVYSQIAHHFARTRERPWREVVEFLDDVLSGGGPGRMEGDGAEACSGEGAGVEGVGEEREGLIYLPRAGANMLPTASG